jgi:hypothetical protein
MQLPFSEREGAWVTYASGTFAPDFDQVIEIAIHPSQGLAARTTNYKQLLLDQDPADTDAGFIVPYVNRINIGGEEYRGFARMYRQTTDGLRSAPASLFFDSGDTPAFAPAASDYDGATNFALRGSDLTGNADSKLLTFSVWFRVDGGDGLIRRLQDSQGTRFFFDLTATNTFRCRVRNVAGTTLLDFSTTSTFLAGVDWHSIQMSFDLEAASQFVSLAVDGVLETPTITTGPVDDNVDWTRTEHSIGATPAGANFWDGCVSQLYFNNAVALDMANPDNIRLFIDGDGNPEFLGASGSFPTNSTPIIFITDGDPSVNAGSGGNFVNQAAIGACGTTP